MQILHELHTNTEFAPISAHLSPYRTSTIV